MCKGETVGKRIVKDEMEITWTPWSYQPNKHCIRSGSDTNEVAKCYLQ